MLKRVLLCFLFLSVASGASAQQRVEFTRMVAHWSDYGRPDYLSFIQDAEPEVVQLGFYGGHFYSLAHTQYHRGYPAHFPLMGLREQGEWFELMNREIHKKPTKIVGHFNCKYLFGSPDGPEGPTGFFKFYKTMWNKAELGPKPVNDPLTMLEVDVDGQPIVNPHHNVGNLPEYWACLLNPDWRTVLKAWAKRGIERGVDGYMVNYFYRHNCLCKHCQQGFRDHLREHFSPEQIKQQFAIANLDDHKFSEIVAWHKPEESTPLRREMLRFSQIANKRAIDDVMFTYARSLKPDLIVGQWNHLSNFSAISGDERCMLPIEMWGRGEDYLWYSSGASAVYTDLQTGFLGDLTLQCRYIRGMFDDKPYTMGKYEHTRIRAAISELAANGGAPMGFYTQFRDPEAREVIVRYYQFLKRYDALYKANRPWSEVLVVFPHTAVQSGDLKALEAFRTVGRQLLDDHVLFDVLPNEFATSEARARYRTVVEPVAGSDAVTKIANQLSRFDVPQTVRVSASIPRDGGEATVHFVNYNRIEPEKPKSPGSGIVDEKPIPAKQLKGDVVLPQRMQVATVELVTPEQPEPVKLDFKQTGDRVQFTVPEILVYGVVRLRAR
ncbi:MAG: hypothetical protein JNM18_21775 [Planctomycetaceae bacterium]|nr:hypothetical protein [Planctomycetaceae bacterium]